MALPGIVMAAASVSSPAKPATEQTGTYIALKQAIGEVLNSSAAAWREGNLDRFMGCYEHTPAITYVSGGTVTKGYDAIKAMYASRFGGPGGSLGLLTVEIFDVQILDRKHVYVIGRFKLDRGVAEPSHVGVTTLLFRQTPKGWRIIADHS